MRKLIVIGIILGLVMAYPLYAEAQSCKIGLVDMAKFQQESVAFQRIRLQLEKKLNKLKEELDAKKQEIVNLEQELRKQSLMLSLDAKEDKARELEKKKRYYKYLYDEFSQEARQAQQDAKRTIANELQKIVEEIGKKEGYTIILDKGVAGLIYYDDAIDITDRIIKAYDKMKGNAK
ncbi:MAG: hypothetical protein DRH12_00550 [Deltaproteobacteria bacterium]|nr:MAG: hypothetical protein DRH12_00550 [Deltaproteobacteria bacterium]RLB80697.1 MAG: hypothetical protein DRH15_07350 [Deltaproteobacteria bacterium]